MITVDRTTINSLSNDFVPIFESVFDTWTMDGNTPYHVYLVKDNDKLVGFASGFAIGLNTWYLQRAGFIKDEQKKISNYFRSMFGIEEILKDWNHIMTLVSNEKPHVLKMMIALGFKIIGTRMDTERGLWVEFLKSKEITNG